MGLGFHYDFNPRKLQEKGRKVFMGKSERAGFQDFGKCKILGLSC